MQRDRSVGSIGSNSDLTVCAIDLGEAAGWAWVWLIRGDGLLADVAIVALPASDTMSPAAQLGDRADVAK